MKMLGKVKKFGRCNVKGHGSDCEVSDEIQNTPLGRTAENRMVRDEINQEIDDLILTKEYKYYCSVCDKDFNRLVVVSQKDNIICEYCHTYMERK